MSITRTTSSRGTALVNSPATVESIMQRLLTDPMYVIEVMAYNNFKAVRARTELAFGKAPNTPAQLSDFIQGAYRQGQRGKVLYAISVPWEYRGDDALEQAVSALRSEATALMTDPMFRGSLKQLPTTGSAGDIDMWLPDLPANAPATTSGGTAAAPRSESGSNSEFWNSLPGILTGLGGLVGAFTGNVAGPGPNATTPPAPAGRTNWVLVTVVVLGLAALITGAVYLFRKK